MLAAFVRRPVMITLQYKVCSSTDVTHSVSGGTFVKTMETIAQDYGNAAHDSLLLSVLCCCDRLCLEMCQAVAFAKDRAQLQQVYTAGACFPGRRLRLRRLWQA